MIDGTLFGEHNHCFGCGPSHPFGFHLRADELEDGSVEAMLTPEAKYEGAPGIMHGGLVTTLADEIAAWALISKLGKFGFTTKMISHFRSPVRIGQETVARARVSADRRRLVDISVSISQAGVLCFEGELTFILLGREAVEKMLGRPLPKAWERFAR
jgi:acyl-coenzyme A thioesterase PaaI-like protein